MCDGVVQDVSVGIAPVMERSRRAFVGNTSATVDKTFMLRTLTIERVRTERASHGRTRKVKGLVDCFEGKKDLTDDLKCRLRERSVKPVKHVWNARKRRYCRANYLSGND